MDIRDFFLMSHAHTHASIPSDGESEGREARLYKGMSEADLRLCPGGRHNSIVWLVWHMARCEDVFVNTVLRAVPEVLDDGWVERVGVSTRHIGTDDTMAEVEAFSQQVEVTALRSYRAAVGLATHQWAGSVDLSSLDKVLKREGVERAAQRGAFTERSDWVRAMWGDEEGSEISWLSWIAIGHNHSHIGEALVTKGLILHPRQ